MAHVGTLLNNFESVEIATGVAQAILRDILKMS